MDMIYNGRYKLSSKLNVGYTIDKWLTEENVVICWKSILFIKGKNGFDLVRDIYKLHSRIPWNGLVQTSLGININNFPQAPKATSTVAHECIVDPR